MIETTTLYLFIGATFLLIAIPGPVVSLIMAETLKHGSRFGIAVVAGATLVSVFFLTLYILGAAPLIAALGDYLDVIKIAGIVYLFYMGLTTIIRRKQVADALVIKARKPFDAFKSAIFITASSPKTILFFAAFFPQFIDFDREVTPQLLTLSGVFILVAFTLDSTWILIARSARRLLSGSNMQERLNMLSGVILCSAAVFLIFLQT